MQALHMDPCTHAHMNANAHSLTFMSPTSATLRKCIVIPGFLCMPSVHARQVHWLSMGGFDCFSRFSSLTDNIRHRNLLCRIPDINKYKTENPPQMHTNTKMQQQQQKKQKTSAIGLPKPLLPSEENKNWISVTSGTLPHS